MSESRGRPLEENPYEAPRSAAGGREASHLYWIDCRRLTYAELWRLVDNPYAWLVLTLAKTLRLPIRIQTDFADLDRLVRVERAALALWVLESARETEAACEAAGLAFQFAFRRPSPGAIRVSVALVHLSGDRLVLGAIHVFHVRSRHLEQLRVVLALSSELSDSRHLVTTNAARILDSQPRCDAVHLKGRPPEAVIAEHRKRLDETGAAAVPYDPDRLEAIELGYHHEIIQFHVQRGVFVPMTVDEVRRLDKKHGRWSGDEAEEVPCPEGALSKALRRLGAYLNLVVILLILSFLIWPPITPNGLAPTFVAMAASWFLLVGVITLRHLVRFVNRRRAVAYWTQRAAAPR